MKIGKKILIGFFTILIAVLVVLGFKMWVDNRGEEVANIGDKRAKINTVLYIEELKIPFYTEEIGEVEKIFNDLITAPIVKVKDESVDIKTLENTDKLVLQKEFKNYKDVDTIVSELQGLPKNEVIKYLEDNKYAELLEKKNKGQIYSVLLNLALEEQYKVIENWFRNRNITENEFLIMENTMPTDIMILGLDKVSILNNFSVLKGQEILRTIVEYLNFELLKENRGEIPEKSADEILQDIKEILGVAELYLTAEQEKVLLEKIPLLKEEIKKFFKENPDLLKEPTEKELGVELQTESETEGNKTVEPVQEGTTTVEKK